MSKLVKIELLNDGGYGHEEGVEFPVVVDAMQAASGFEVRLGELRMKGLAPRFIAGKDFPVYFSAKKGECRLAKLPRHYRVYNAFCTVVDVSFMGLFGATKIQEKILVNKITMQALYFGAHLTIENAFKELEDKSGWDFEALKSHPEIKLKQILI